MQELFSKSLVLSYEAQKRQGGEFYEEKEVLSIGFEFSYDNVAFWLRGKGE